MRSPFSAGHVLLLLALGAVFHAALQAQLVTPPTFDYISIPSTASVNDTITISAEGQGNYSDNSDGNNWNAGTMPDILAIIVEYQPPGGSWTNLYFWCPVEQTPNSMTASLNLNIVGTWTFNFQLMDGRPWYSDIYTYTVTVSPPPTPVITSSLTVPADQNQSVSYQVTATSSPTSFSASNLPPGLSLNTSTGVISGTATTPGTVTSTITATNSNGTGPSTSVVWTITAATITPAASVSPTTVILSQSVTLTQAGTANFGVAWTENTIWDPNGSAEVIGDKPLGSVTYTPDAGPGTYSYQFRLVDIYDNFEDQWITFEVDSATVTAPTSFAAVTVGSTFITLDWSGAGGSLGVASYLLYKNGTLMGSVTGTSFTDNDVVTPGTTYTYTIAGVDTAGNVSALSSPLTVTAAPDLEVFTPSP